MIKNIPSTYLRLSQFYTIHLKNPAIQLNLRKREMLERLCHRNFKNIN